MEYKPSEEIIKKYAKVMVHYALNGGKGINKGETVCVIGNDCGKDLYMAVCKEIWEAGGNVIHRYLPAGIERYGLNRTFLEVATDEQLQFFARPFWQGLTDSIDHLLFIMADANVHALEGIPAARIAMSNESMAPFMEMRAEKEKLGKLGWTICMYGTQSAADEVGLTLEEYWQQIIKACYLDDEDPVARWQKTELEILTVKQKLNELNIKKVHIEGEGIDLHITIGENRQWLGGRGKNIPSFEIFTSPDYRYTEGTISFNQPLYYSGTKITGIKLRFEKGVVVEATADENQDALREMLSRQNANRLGEFSLTDRRHSMITHIMATTLYDENMGGEEGNTHIAVGNCYPDTYAGNREDLTPELMETLGYNICPKVHVDIISTTRRKVTATLHDGNTVVIYENGQFTFI